MRIGLIGSSRFACTPPFAGGLEAHTWQLRRGLEARGHDVTVFDAASLAAFAPSATSRADVSAEPDDVIRSHHVLLAALRDIATGRFDVVHNNSIHHLPIVLAPILGAPMVSTLHCPPTPWLESAFALSDETGSVISVSRSNARSWEHVVDATVIHNGVDCGFWRPTGADRRGAVWTGRIVPEKAPHVAIEAARRAGMPLRLAGPVNDAAYFDELVRPALTPGRVEYLGHLRPDAAARLVAEAEVVLVTPAWEEPFGLVVAEALASGTPVAAFDRGALPELLDDRIGRLAPPDDADALATAAVEAAVLDKEACRATAVARFSVEAMLEAYGTVFADAVAAAA